jgi:hypothetical protein
MEVAWIRKKTFAQIGTRCRNVESSALRFKKSRDEESALGLFISLLSRAVAGCGQK